MSSPLTPIISTATLAEQLNNPDIRLIDVSSLDEYEAAHIEGAVQLDYAAFVTAKPPIMGLVPELDQLCLVLSATGLRPDQHVIAYDREGGGKAGRLIYTLDAIGHTNNSLLDGGLQAWLEDGHGTVSGRQTVPHTQYEPEPDGNNIADKAYIQSRLGASNLALLDCRTAAEYSGQDVRAAKGGHIPGAVNFNWTDAMDPEHPPKLRDLEALRASFAAMGVTPDKEVIAYCQTHHRSSHTYVLLKQLGFTNVKGYPGAWSDWGNDPQTPVEL